MDGFKSVADEYISIWIIMDVKAKFDLIKAIAICTFAIGYMLWIWFEDAPVEEHHDHLA